MKKAIGIYIVVLLAGTVLAQGKEERTASGTARIPAASAAAVGDSYVIGNDDLLAINVWKEDEISRTLPVRPDGKITLPLVGDVKAAGLTPLELRHSLETKLAAYLDHPTVTVIVQEVRSKKFNIVGQVQHPGAYELTPPMTVLDAIAAAGGFRDWAKVKDIYVLRTHEDGRVERLPFNYKDVIRGKQLTQNVQLVPKDTIVVP
jgi:polysaccharide export outer membrane protein